MIKVTKFTNLSRLLCRDRNVSSPICRQISTAAFPLNVKVSCLLCAQPMKAKKHLDPAIVKEREMKRRKKIEKQIRSLQKLKRTLKPIEELQVPLCLLQDKESRERKIEVPVEFKEQGAKILKKWTIYKREEYKNNVQLLGRLMQSQIIALNELRLESEELYQAAVKIDQDLIPFKYSGPVETPPIKNYSSPDGDYVDISRKWE